MKRCFLLLMLAVPLMGQTLEVCRGHRHHGRLQEASACFEKLTASPDAYLRAEGFWGLGRHLQANDAFRAVVEREPKNAVYRVRWGRLYYDRMQRQDAAKLFEEALEISPGNPGALLGLALVASDGYERRRSSYRNAAGLTQFAEPRELLARLASRRRQPA
jgi:tetratricopeptide (TPR) repeat protein